MKNTAITLLITILVSAFVYKVITFTDRCAAVDGTVVSYYAGGPRSKCVK